MSQADPQVSECGRASTPGFDSSELFLSIAYMSRRHWAIQVSKASDRYVHRLLAKPSQRHRPHG